MDSISPNKKMAGIVSASSKSVKKDINSDKSDAASSSNNKNGFRRRKKFYRKGKGVIYLGHIPHGFYEDEMRSYFNQFGKVRATTVARSKKTGRSRGYGFVEFDDEEVAKIAAETMNNYLMYNKVLKCRYIPPEERKGKIFSGKFISNDYPRKKNRILNLKQKMKALSNYNQSAYLQKTMTKINEFKKFFDERGIDFNFKFSPIKSVVGKLDSEPAGQANDQYGVLEIDESDHEISFKTPPKVKKVIKKSSNTPSGSLKNVNYGNTQTGKKVKLKALKNSNFKSTQNIKEIKKNSKKTSVDFQKMNQKNKSNNKKLKSKEKLLAKSSETKKLRPSKKNISAAPKQKSAKMLKTNDLGLAKKVKNTKLKSKISDSNANRKTKIEIIM